MTRRRTGRGGRRPPVSYRWTGVQASNIALSSTDTAVVLLDDIDINEAGTLVRIRGHLIWEAITATGNLLRAKLLYMEINDAAAITGDHSASDTSREDIAARILWEHTWVQSAINTEPAVDVEIDVKAKMRLRLGEKFVMALLLFATSASRSRASLNMRALIQNA